MTETQSWAVAQSVNEKKEEKRKITTEMDREWVTVVVYFKKTIRPIHSINIYPTPTEQLEQDSAIRMIR